MAGSGRVEESTLDVDGVETFVRCVDGEGPPAVFVHGHPSHSEDWVPFLERVEAPAIALDLPGWGRSERPPDFDYSMQGLAAFFARVLDRAGIAEHRLVIHDWGALALIAEQNEPDLLRRLAIINAVPLSADYRWHWVARLWRRRGVGELLNLTATRPAAGLLLRQASGGRGPMPREFVDSIWRYRQRGLGRSVLSCTARRTPSAWLRRGRSWVRSDVPRWWCGASAIPTSARSWGAATRPGFRTRSCWRLTAPATGPGSIARRSSRG